jgi:hypothetical protein
VVRCPRRTLDGSLCQNDLVELGVGNPAWLDEALVPVIAAFWCFLNIYTGGRGLPAGVVKGENVVVGR